MTDVRGQHLGRCGGLAQVVQQGGPACSKARLQPRGGIAIKGKGVMSTHFLLRRGDAMSPEELLGPSSPQRTFKSAASAGSVDAASVGAD